MWEIVKHIASVDPHLKHCCRSIVTFSLVVYVEWVWCAGVYWTGTYRDEVEWVYRRRPRGSHPDQERSPQVPPST
jgi:hypothetical protein